MYQLNAGYAAASAVWLCINPRSALSAFCIEQQNAEFERNLIRERTLAGLKAARARGRKGGRPRKLSSKDLKTVKAMLKSGDIPVSTVAEKFHVARSTLYRNAGNYPPTSQG